MTVFARALEAEDKAMFLRRGAAIGDRQTSWYQTPLSELSAIPGSPFAYWLSASIRDAFVKCEPLDSPLRESRQGLATSDDFRFLRGWWELKRSRIAVTPFAKGGQSFCFYVDPLLEIRWDSARRQLDANLDPSGRPRSNIWMLSGTVERYFGRPGLTWPRRTNGFHIGAMPSGCAFADKGPAIFVRGDVSGELLCTLAVCSSAPFMAMIDAQLARTELAQSFELGLIRSSPFPFMTKQFSAELADLAREGWSLRRSLDSVVEVSHAFVLPAVLQVEGSGFGARVGAWAGRVAEVEERFVGVQAEIDELCFELYGISEEDRRAITEGFGGAGVEEPGIDSDSDSDDVGDESGDGVELDPVGLAAGLVSWAVGVAVGRFDVRLATGERGWPVEPDPFDALPVCSPAMLTGADGLPVEVLPAGYPVEVSPVLVHDPGHGLEVTSRVRSVFEAVFGDEADAWWSDAGVALGAKGGDVSTWLTKGFFGHHLKTHSRSRRKAPILWPLGTRSGSYLVWLYAHRVSADSLFRVLTDVVEPKVRAEEQQLTLLRQEAGPEPTASQRKSIDTQERFVDELRELAETIGEVAPLWAPDLNDGVVIVLAPLWRLFAHHRGWSKELERHWDKLAAGDYDWAQLAMHLWPERVVPKCAEDRSLAIAHGLEDVFWVQDDPGTDKWHARTNPSTPIDQLVGDRRNPATAAALQRQT